MAWQTPKTDWAPEDGVLAEDFNRIEENIAELKRTAAPYLSSTVTYYVATTGNDNNSGLTADAPLATIQAAFDKIPKNLNGYNGHVIVAAGTYAGFSISDFHGGTITLSNRNGGAVNISSAVSISDCGKVTISDMSALTIQGQLYVENCTEVFCSVPTSIANTVYEAINVSFATVLFNGLLTLTSATYAAAILSQSGAKVYAETLVINSPSGTGITADTSGSVSYGTITNNSTTKTLTRRGGRILAGAQTSVPNY